jgi:hypothetical protein
MKETPEAPSPSLRDMCPLLDRHNGEIRQGGVNRDGSNVQKQLAEAPNTMLGRIHLADVSSTVSRRIETTLTNRSRRLPDRQR